MLCSWSRFLDVSGLRTSVSFPPENKVPPNRGDSRAQVTWGQLPELRWQMILETSAHFLLAEG